MSTLDSAPVAVAGELSYYSGTTTDGERPYQLMFDSPGPHQPFTNSLRDERQIPIHDLRPILGTEAAKEISTDTTGFDVVPKELSGTSMKYEDWDDEDKIKTVYLPEVETMLKRHLGATKVIFFDWTVRRGEREGEETADTPSSRKPVSAVHVDQTPLSGERRVRRHAGDDAERLLRGRSELINIWRPFRTVFDTPLAVADARTLDHQTDLVASRLIYPAEGQPGYQVEGETSQITYSDRHRWYYLSEMQPDEALLLKCWEYLPDGKSGTITPHTAWKDPRYYGKEGVPLRQSIEVRALVFHEPEE